MRRCCMRIPLALLALILLAVARAGAGKSVAKCLNVSTKLVQAWEGPNPTTDPR